MCNIHVYVVYKIEHIRTWISCICTYNVYITQYGRTALIEAASGGHADIVTLLLDGGADPNLIDQVTDVYSQC